jgi:hypothetical protein
MRDPQLRPTQIWKLMHGHAYKKELSDCVHTTLAIHRICLKVWFEQMRVSAVEKAGNSAHRVNFLRVPFCIK